MAANLKFRAKKMPSEITEKKPSKTNRSDHKCNIWLPDIQRCSWYGITAVIAFLCHVNSFYCDLVHDDVFAIKENHDIRTNSPVTQVFKNDFWGKPMSSNTSHKSYRPLCVLTFRLNFMIHALEPFGYHLVNVVIHIWVCLVFVYFLEKVVLRSIRLAMVAGILFASHPVHTEAVTGVVGRADVLGCLLFLLSFLGFNRSTCTNVANNALCQPLYMLACILLGGMAMLVKEQGITVFGVCLIYDVFVVNKVWQRLLKGSSLSSLIQTSKPLIGRSVILTFVVFCLMSFRIWMLGGSLPHFTKQDNPASFSHCLPTRVMTYCYLFAFNLGLLLSPSTLCYDWQVGSIPLVETLWDGRNLATIGFFLVIGLLSYYCLLSRGEKEEDQNTVFLGLALLVIPFVPASNLLFRVGFVVAERILYIPSMGFCILVTFGVNKLASVGSNSHKDSSVTKRLRSAVEQESVHGADKQSLAAKLTTLGLAVLVVLFCWKTVTRNEVWKTRKALFRSGVETLPHNAKVHYNYGNFLKDVGEDDAASRHYRTAIQLQPDYVSAHNNLGTLLEDDQDAIEHFKIAIKHDPMHANSYFNLGARFGTLHKLDDAEKALKEAIRLRPGYVDAMMNLAGILSEKEQYSQTESLYKQILELSPDSADGYNNYGVFLGKIGALSYYKKTIQLNPDHSVAYVNMGRLLKREGRMKEAEVVYKRALTIKREASTLQLLGVLYYNEERLSEAERAWGEALKLNPTDEETQSNMGVLLSRTGRLSEAVLVCESLLKQNPSKPDHYKNLATALAQAGRTHEAIKIINAALVRFDDADLYFHQGNLLKDTNNMKDAKQSFMKAVQLNDKHSSAHMNLGVILHIEKSYSEARKHYKAALKLDPDNTVLRQNLAKLSRVERNQ